MRKVLLLAALLLPPGCAGVQPFVPDTARMPAGAMGQGTDPDVWSMNIAQWAFADPGRTYGRPAEAARAAAAMDYLAGAFYTSPRWARLSALTKEQLLQGRAQVRAALGVVPGTPSQVVVNQLMAAFNALSAGDDQAALRYLGPPAFAIPAPEVLARLSNMPYLQMANVSTMRAANEMFDGNVRDLF